MTDEVTVHHGDALEVLAGMPDASVDAVVTDPPYGLEFMGREWDAPWKYGFAENPMCRTCRKHKRGTDRCHCETPDYDETDADSARLYQAWCEQWAAECLRLLKPGGHLLAFGGSRTFHRLTCAVEDAGFEIRDTISWLYGSGFPKSLDVSKAIDARQSGANEKAQPPNRDEVEPRPGAQSVSTDAYRYWGDGARVTAPASPDAEKWRGWGTALKPAHEPVVVARKPLAGTVAANVLAHGTGALNIDGCRVDGGERPYRSRRHDPALDETCSAYGAGINGSQADGVTAAGRWPANVVLDEDAAAELDRQSGILTSGAIADGSITKAGRSGGIMGQAVERVRRKGYESSQGGASRFYYTAKAAPDERPRVDGVAHPTVKPLDLMRWLVRLVTPPGGLVLDPFAGSGTTGEACLIEGFRCVLVENYEDYLPLIEARLSKPLQPVLGEELSA